MPLPPKDAWGDYWWDRKTGPAVIKTKSKQHDSMDSWYVFLGIEQGFLFNGPRLKRFKRPQDAMDMVEGLTGKK